MGLFPTRRAATLAWLLPVLLALVLPPLVVSGPRQWLTRVVRRIPRPRHRGLPPAKAVHRGDGATSGPNAPMKVGGANPPDIHNVPVEWMEKEGCPYHHGR
jgi:hypothetical protein